MVSNSSSKIADKSASLSENGRQKDGEFREKAVIKADRLADKADDRAFKDLKSKATREEKIIEGINKDDERRTVELEDYNRKLDEDKYNRDLAKRMAEKDKARRKEFKEISKDNLENSYDIIDSKENSTNENSEKDTGKDTGSALSQIGKDVQLTPLGDMVARTQARLNPDKAVYRGVGIPQTVTNDTKTQDVPNSIKFDNKNIPLSTILNKMLSDGKQSPKQTDNKQSQQLYDKFVNYAIDIKHNRDNALDDKQNIEEKSIISTSLSHFVANGYCRNKLHGKPGADNVQKTTDAFPIIFEIFGDKEKPARCMPALGTSTFFGGAEDEIYLSPNSKLSFKQARKDDKNRIVITVTATDKRNKL